MQPLDSQPDCLFCKIAAGLIPCVRVAEDAHTLAFMDIQPGCDGHVLVIPKRHAPDLFAIDEASLLQVAQMVRRVAQALKASLGIDGLNLFQSNGAAAFQSVFHLHVHLLPRREGDDLNLPWQPRSSDPAQLQTLAQRIAAHLPSAPSHALPGETP